MRRIAVAVIVASLVGAVAPLARAQQDPCESSPRCATYEVPTPDGLVVPDDHVRILLPPDYGEPAEASVRYPVLYLLHGAGGSYVDWTDNTDLVATATDDVIIVMPDGGGKSSESGWYSDWFDGSRQWESFHIDVLIPWVDAHFRTLADRGHRAIAGLSMGGFGAMSYAARHPDLFAAAASFSGAVDTMYGFPASGPGFALANGQYGTPDDRVWGNQLENEDEWRAHNPTDLAANLDRTALWISAGTGTPGGPAGDDPSNPGGYALENFIWQMNQDFVRALDSHDIPHHDDFYLGGLHSWPYWQRELHWALPGIMDVIGPAQTASQWGPAHANAPAPRS